MEALHIGCRRSQLRFHIAAANPFGPGRHANLVACAIVADHRGPWYACRGNSHRTCGQIVTAGIVAGVVGIEAVDGVVPVCNYDWLVPSQPRSD